MAPPHHQPAPNIWAQMSYTPPRGPCSQKLSMLTTCPCHRFMIHPLKAPTSFECDGCGHHASFHHLSSREEEGEQGWKAAQQQKTALVGGPHHLRVEEVMKWEMREEGRETLESGGLKRRRRIEGPPLGERRAMAGAFGEEDGVGEDEVVEIGVEEAMRMAEVGGEVEVLEGEGREEAEKREEAERKAKGRKRKGR